MDNFKNLLDLLRVKAIGSKKSHDYNMVIVRHWDYFKIISERRSLGAVKLLGLLIGQERLKRGGSRIEKMKNALNNHLLNDEFKNQSRNSILENIFPPEHFNKILAKILAQDFDVPEKNLNGILLEYQKKEKIVFYQSNPFDILKEMNSQRDIFENSWYNYYYQSLENLDTEFKLEIKDFVLFLETPYLESPDIFEKLRKQGVLVNIFKILESGEVKLLDEKLIENLFINSFKNVLNIINDEFKEVSETDWYDRLFKFHKMEKTFKERIKDLEYEIRKANVDFSNFSDNSYQKLALAERKAKDEFFLTLILLINTKLRFRYF